jgi:hypothetical protein
MILQVLNIAGGAIIASPKIAAVVGQERITTIKEKIAPLESRLGLALVFVGLVGLLERVSFFHTGLNLGSSFPQTLPLIAVGLLMAAPMLEKYPFLQGAITILRPHATWIGLIAIACGAGSLLVGCIFPICYPLAF